MKGDIVLNKKLEGRLKKVPQYTRFKRHFRTIMTHGNPHKLFNLILVEIERKLRRVRVRGYPYYLIIDPTNICNLKCPLCPTGLGQIGRPLKMLDFMSFKTIIDKLSKYAYEVALHNWGEPFLNPDIFRMIEYCREKNIGTNLSTNLNVILQVFKDDWVDMLIKSGLEYLIVSLDGTDQETYGAYKVKGNFHKVIRNMEKIIKRRSELKSKKPVIEWQFIVMKHNIHRVEEATRMAKEMGVDVMRFIPVGLSMYAENKEELAKKWFPEQNSKSINKKGKYRKDMFAQKVQRGPCFYLYRSLTINPIGCVAPCCVIWKKEDDFGNILNKDFKRIWNNRYYISARSIFSRKGFDNRVRTVCEGCEIFEH